MRHVTLALAAPLACTAHVEPPALDPERGDPPSASDPALEPAGLAAPPPARPAAPSIATCPIDHPRALELRVDAVSDIGDVAGERWLVAREAGVPTLLHLDRAGGLARVALERWTEDIAAEGDARLRLFHTDAPARWAAVDLRDPDAPVRGALSGLPGLVPGEHPKGVASDGARALVSLYRENPHPGGERYVGDTFLLSVPDGERIGPRADMTVWTAHCAGGRCYGVATVNDDPQARALVALGDAGARRLDALGRWGCSGLATWLEGQEWMIAWSEPGAIGLAAVHLSTGGHAVGRLPLSGSACAEFEHLAVADRHGLVVAEGRRAFVPISPTLAAGARELLPRFHHPRQRYIAVGDGVLVADFDAASGLRHGPPGPDGTREYAEVWSFAGRHQFLRPAPGEWTAEPDAPLPHDGERGDLGRGYDVHLLARPGHAGVLLAGDGPPSAYLPLRRPCP